MSVSVVVGPFERQVLRSRRASRRPPLNSVRHDDLAVDDARRSLDLGALGRMLLAQLVGASELGAQPSPQPRARPVDAVRDSPRPRALRAIVVSASSSSHARSSKSSVGLAREQWHDVAFGDVIEQRQELDDARGCAGRRGRRSSRRSRDNASRPATYAARARCGAVAVAAWSGRSPSARGRRPPHRASMLSSTVSARSSIVWPVRDRLGQHAAALARERALRSWVQPRRPQRRGR